MAEADTANPPVVDLAPPQHEDEDDEEEKLCRFCLCGDDDDPDPDDRACSPLFDCSL